MMKNLKNLEQKLQRADRKQATLYLFCNFISLMLITAYSGMMFSPTVQTILPDGGDSRKQMYAIFVLALFGCVVFTVYAASLFFRKKSRQLGILMALGASQSHLAPGLFREVLLLSTVSSLFGILAGFPFLLLLWNVFRITMFDTAEMKFQLDFRCLFVSAAFFLLVVVCACTLAFLYLRRTNIIDVVQEEHKNEPVHTPRRWCGPVGIVLLILGGVAGYSSSGIYMDLFQKYPPAWLNLTYAPVFIGLYMIMLHTVTNGWLSHKKHPYKNLISRSMMKFQGRQTVNNLLVSTVLIAGGCFGIFYAPMMLSGFHENIRARAFDYAFHYPVDQKVPDEKEILALAEEYGLSVTDFCEAPLIHLAFDGMQFFEDEGDAFHYEYRELVDEARFLSESSYRRMTGQDIEVAPGTYCGVTTNDGVNTWEPSSGCTLFTNMVTKDTLSVKFDRYLNFELMADRMSYMVLDDGDYEKIAAGLTDDWKENLVYFNIDGKDSYAFARELFHRFAASFDSKYATSTFYSAVQTISSELEGAVYFEGMEDELWVDLSKPDSSEVRMNWTYMPLFRELDANDNIQSYAVFFMVFIFVAIICLTAALVIDYTRCQTIALNNRYLFEDLKRLGASPTFLSEEVHRQCNSVFKLPAIIGMASMLFFYGMILYANDGIFSSDEIIGFVLNLGVIVIISGIIYGVYIHTVHHLCRQLDIARVFA